MKSLTRTSRLVGGIIVALIVAVTANNVSAQKAPKRAITKIAGDLYRFKNNFHYSVFYHLTDPSLHLAAGAKVIVTGVDGATLHVEPDAGE